MKASKILRVLGIGVLAAAVVVGCIMLAQSGSKQKNTEEKGGGKTVTEAPLAQSSEEAPEASKEAASPTEETPVITETPPAPETTAPAATAPVPDQTAEPTAGAGLPSSETGANPAEKKTIEITRGSDSESVARKLESEGIIDDAESFNQYLEQGGYSNRIMAGTYELAPGEPYDSLAKKIAGESK